MVSLLAIFGALPLFIADPRITAIKSILGALLFGLPALLVALSLGYLIFSHVYLKYLNTHLAKVALSGFLSSIICALFTSSLAVYLTDARSKTAVALFLVYCLSIVLVGLLSTLVYWLLTKSKI
jgi:hypothetical protein